MSKREKKKADAADAQRAEEEARAAEAAKAAAEADAAAKAAAIESDPVLKHEAAYQEALHVEVAGALRAGLAEFLRQADELERDGLFPVFIRDTAHSLAPPRDRVDEGFDNGFDDAGVATAWERKWECRRLHSCSECDCQ